MGVTAGIAINAIIVVLWRGSSKSLRKNEAYDGLKTCVISFRGYNRTRFRESYGISGRREGGREEGFTHEWNCLDIFQRHAGDGFHGIAPFPLKRIWD